MARVWDPKRRRPVSSQTFRSPSEGLAWQEQMRAAFRSQAPGPVSGITVAEACDRFLLAIKDGRALNKRGKRYKKSAIGAIEGALEGRIVRALGSLPLDGVRREQLQAFVDEMVAEELSVSRVRNVLNALRSLYTYAIAHELAHGSPVANILLPAIDETPRDRIATPQEFQELLLALKPADAVPFALAGYATARSQEILNLVWGQVDWGARIVQLADSEEYAKSDAARRTVPLILKLKRILRAEWKHQGRPSATQLVRPARKAGSSSGMLSVPALYTRADRAWDAEGLAHIRLHECRHTASSWQQRVHAVPVSVENLFLNL
jgi:integrase